MKQFELSGKQYLAIPVPKDAYDFKDTITNGIIFKRIDGDYDSIYFDEINENLNYKIISTLSNLSEEWCDSVVDKERLRNYKNYKTFRFQGLPFNAKKSFITKLQSNGILVKNNVKESYDELLIIEIL